MPQSPSKIAANPRCAAGRRALAAVAAGLCVLALGACQQRPGIPTLAPYRMDIQQGNVVTQEMLAKLKPGMTPSQVRFILGTPLVVDAFHKDRWDYVYRYSKGGTLQEARRIVVVFKDDRLDRIEGDVVPAQGGATEGAAGAVKPAPAGKDASAKPQPKDPAPESNPVSGGSGGAKPEEKAADKPAEEKPKEERGFFGRMLDRLGF